MNSATPSAAALPADIYNAPVFLVSLKGRKAPYEIEAADEANAWQYSRRRWGTRVVAVELAS